MLHRRGHECQRLVFDRRRRAGSAVRPRGNVGQPRAIAAEKPIEHRVAVLGGRRLGMKLHADDRVLAMLNGHDLMIVARGRQHTQLRWNVSSTDDERVIPRNADWRWHAGEDARAVMHDRRRLAVNRAYGPHNRAAVRCTNALVAKAYAEN